MGNLCTDILCMYELSYGMFCVFQANIVVWYSFAIQRFVAFYMNRYRLHKY